LGEIARAAGATACVTAALYAAEAVVGAPRAAGLGEESGLPRGLRRWLDDVRRDPLLAVLPTPPALARVRWAVAAGRRWALVKGTLRPAGEDQGTGLRAAAAVVRRAGGLARRWGATVLR
jgi:hypothetical protein